MFANNKWRTIISPLYQFFSLSSIVRIIKVAHLSGIISSLALTNQIRKTSFPRVCLSGVAVLQSSISTFLMWYAGHTIAMCIGIYPRSGLPGAINWVCNTSYDLPPKVTVKVRPGFDGRSPKVLQPLVFWVRKKASCMDGIHTNWQWSALHRCPPSQGLIHTPSERMHMHSMLCVLCTCRISSLWWMKRDYSREASSLLLLHYTANHP